MAVTGVGQTPGAATDPTGASSAASSNPVGNLANEQTFLKLLVSQIRNQDPMSPTDSTQFVTQLAQFSQLEQLIGINQGISNLNTDLTSTNSTSGSQTPGASGAASS